ncbi:hypothetical protein AAW51_3122 [Caldimonas brevitalea]|uniref:AsmA domain-containing protein n=1 Tax=Caldimonas brevitalea TaxID=413882 RepID=A0A0G3BPC6_9BURK|nr:hypothetical protein AAW51_3122 [Caldimonas brevitalea]
MLLALMLAFAVCEWAGWPFLRGPLQRALQDKLQREVVVGEDFRLRLLGGLKLQTDQFAIAAPAWAAENRREELIRAEGVRLVLPYSTVLSPLRRKPDEPAEPLRIRALEVRHLKASFWRTEDGRANWQFTPPDPQKKKAETELPSFDRLVVGGGEVRYDDEVIGLQMRALARTEEGSANANGAGLVIEGDGHYREGEARFSGAKFGFRIASEGLLPLLTPEDDNGTPVPFSLHASAGRAKFEFKGQAVDVLHLRGFSGDFSISGPSLAAVGAPAGVTLPSTGPFDMNGKLSKDGELWKASVGRLAVGTSRLAGDFTYDRRHPVPLLTGELRGDSLTLRDLGPAFGAQPPNGKAPKDDDPPAPEKNKKQDKDGQVLPAKEFNIPSLKAMNADVRVNLKKLDLGTQFLGDLTPLQGRISLRDGVLNIRELLARASGGEVRGSIGLDSRPSQPRWAIDLRWAGVDLDRWVKARNNRAEQGAEDSYITGILGGQAKFDGVGKSTAAMLGSLDGDAAFWIRDGQISHLIVEALGIDLAQGLGIFLKGDAPLPMHCAVGRFTSKGGTLDTQVGLIDTPDSLVLFDGTLSLATEQLALVLRAQPKDFSPVSLRSPVHLSGTFSEPKVRLEGKTLGLKLLASAALAAVNPFAALIPLIDPGEGEKNGCRDALQRLRGTGGGKVSNAPATAAAAEGAVRSDKAASRP